MTITRRKTQFVQGWLMHDRFVMKNASGAPYEFLWANPYQPGLAMIICRCDYHDKRAGRLFVRSSWEEDATWFGYRTARRKCFAKGSRSRCR